MRIVAVNRFYRPDHSATSQILTELAEALVADGHQFTVVTSRIGYEDAGADLPKREILDGVDVIRVPSTGLGRSGVLSRMVDYGTYYFSAIFTMFAEVRKGDILLAKTDPPMMSVAAAVVAKLKSARLVNWCQDLFPEVAGALGMGWANGPAGKLLKWLRNRSLRSAEMNVAINENMRERLEAEGVPATSVVVLHNWCDARIKPVDRTQSNLRREWGLSDQTVIGYSGNLGRAHLPEPIGELLRRTDRLPGLSWVFIGGGKGLESVRSAADALETEVQFRPYQPLDQLSESLSVPDIHLISLDPACEGLIMPSKYYGVLAVDRPVLFLGSRDGAIAREISQNGHGAVLDVDEPDTWRPVVERLMADHARLRGLIAPSSGHAGLNEWRRRLGAMA